MSDITLEIILIVLLVILNGVFAMSETAIISARKIRLQQWATAGDKGAQAALDLVEEPNRFLSAVQIGITLIGILAGAFGGATLAEELGRLLAQVAFIGPEYGEAVGLTIVVIGITYLSLVIGELAPKRLALNNAERIAARIARPMRLLAIVTAPAVRLLSFSTEGILRLMGVKDSVDPPITEEEIKIMVEQGARAGQIEQVEREIVESVFRLGDRRAGSLMTPRTEIIWLDIDATAEEIHDTLSRYNHSRFPVCQGYLDKVLGVVLVKDLMADVLNGQPVNLQKHLRQPLFLPENSGALSVLERFKQAGIHIALLIDEYGGIEGMVTLNNLLEAIVGDFPAFFEPREPQAMEREDGSWLLDGLLPADEFKALFGFKHLPAESYYQTLGGFVVTQLARIPLTGDHFDWQGFRLEVVDMDGNRVDKVLVVPPAVGGQ